MGGARCDRRDRLIGDQVVVGVDRDWQRISLSIKRLDVDPWQRHLDQLDTGQTGVATISGVMPHGRFARVADVQRD